MSHPSNRPLDPKPPTNGRTVAVVGSVGVAAAIFAVVAQWEGKENVGYRDIVGIATICYGDTRNVTVGKRVTDEECAERLDRQVANHAAPVIRCVPALRRPERANQLVASTSLAYNVGVGAFCSSTAARRFNAGDWRGGCEAFMRWNRAGGRTVRGLTNRRTAERAICLRGLS